MAAVKPPQRPHPRDRAARGVEPEPRADRARTLWSVYLLRCADGTLYAGATNNIARRLAAHARGRVKYTRGRLPIELRFVETVGEKSAALSREAALKRKSRTAKLRLCGLPLAAARAVRSSRPAPGRRRKTPPARARGRGRPGGRAR